MASGVPIPEPIRISERDLARGEEIEQHYEKPIAAWAIEHAADRCDFTRAQRWRFNLWEATGWSVADATMLSRWQFVRFLIRTDRLGHDDDVKAGRLTDTPTAATSSAERGETGR